MAIPNVRAGGQALSTRAGFQDLASLLVLPAICLLPLLLTLPFMDEPFERDEGVYATVAQGLLRGDLPYRDLFDHKPPLIYVWYAVSFLVLGEGIVAPRIFAAIAWSLTTLVVFRQTDLLFSRGIALAAALLFALSSAFVMLQANANTEAFMLLPATFCLYAATRCLNGGSTWWLIGVGVAGGISVFTKQVAMLNLGAAAVVIAVQSLRDEGFVQMLRKAVIIGGSATAVAVIILTPFAVSGALDEFLYANWTYNRLYAAQEAFSDRVDAEVRGLRLFVVVAAPLVLPAVLGLIGRLRRLLRPGELILSLWVLAAYAGILLSGRGFPHYYVSLLPPLAVFGAVGLVLAIRTPRSVSLAFPLLAFAGLISVAVNGSAYLKSTPEEKHEVRFRQVQPQMQSQSPIVAMRIAELTSPGQTIYNYGRETQLYFYSGRKPAIRFLYDRPFWLDPPTIDEAIASLRAAPPSLIVDSVRSRDEADWGATHPQALRDLLAAEYDFVERVEFADLYLLKAER